jgi:hypothetical protein
MDNPEIHAKLDTDTQRRQNKNKNKKRKTKNEILFKPNFKKKFQWWKSLLINLNKPNTHLFRPQMRDSWRFGLDRFRCFCRSLFVLLYFFFWPLYCLFFFRFMDYGYLPLVSSNFSCKLVWFCICFINRVLSWTLWPKLNNAFAVL